jgi:hypothetical protein
MEESDVAAPEEPADDVDHFDEIMQNIWHKHRRLISKFKAKCGLEVDDTPDEEEEDKDTKAQQDELGRTEIIIENDEPEPQQQTLLQRLAQLLRRNGVELDEEKLYQSVIRTVDRLCTEASEQKMARLCDEAEEDDGNE